MTDQSAAVAAVFDRAAPSYDSVGVDYFRPIGRRLVDRLGPRPGESALDVGCGRGAVLLPLAEAVLPGGSVTGIDLAPAMVEAAMAHVRQRGWAHVDVRVADARAPALPAASFDVVGCSLVLFFLPDPGEALHAWHGLLRPEGRLGLTTFGPQDTRWTAVDEVFRPFLPQTLLDAIAAGRRGPFSSDAGVEALVRQAGFDDVRTETFDLHVTFDDAAQWHRWTWSQGQRVMWESVPPEHRDAVRADAFEVLEGCRDADGRIAFDQTVRITLGRRPPG